MGKDKSKNNLAIYSNGEYCFSCRYYKKYNKAPPKPTEHPISKFPYLLVQKLPEKYLEYLYDFGITDSTIRNYYCYSEDLDRLCFHVSNFTEARSLTKDPKALSWGAKPICTFPYEGVTNCFVVFVEDVISMFKVSYVWPSACLFGSSLSESWIQTIKNRGLKPVFWLDSNKIGTSRELRDKFRAMGIESSVIFTPKDPKYYFKYQITEFVKRATVSFTKPSKPEKTGLVARWNPMYSKMEEVPTNSARAVYWPAFKPKFIPDLPLKAGHCWRYFKLTDEWRQVQIGSASYFLQDTDPGRSLQTIWNNNAILQELDPPKNLVTKPNGLLDNQALVNISGFNVPAKAYTNTAFVVDDLDIP